MRSLARLALLSTTLVLTSGARAEGPMPTAADAAAKKPTVAADAVVPAAPAQSTTAAPPKTGAKRGTDAKSGVEEQSSGDSAATAAASTDDTRAESPPPAVPSPYEIAIRSLTQAAGSGLKFEATLTAADGQVQQATGSALGSVYSVTIRTRPEPDPNADGRWLVERDKYRKRSDSGVTESDDGPAAISLFLDALQSLPATEAGLSSVRAAASEVAGVACKPRSLKMPAGTHLVELGVCVDEANARIARLDGRTPAGERLTVVLSLVEAAARTESKQSVDWASEFPRAKPEDRAAKLEYPDCPELISVLPQGCKGFDPRPAKKPKRGDAQRDD